VKVRTIGYIVGGILASCLILFAVALVCLSAAQIADDAWGDEQKPVLVEHVRAGFTPELIPPEKPAISYPSPYMLDGSTIVQIICSDLTAGTAFYLGSGRYMTAAHVVAGSHKCWIAGQRLTIEQMDRKRDFALFRADHYPAFRAAISCERLREGETYFATGYAQGNEWPVTSLVRATGQHSLDDGTAEINGSLVDGMSGGPVADRGGAIHAINDWRDGNGSPVAGVVELADTPLCRKA
jgi:hypothetical protein